MTIKEGLPRRPNSKVERVFPFVVSGEPRAVIEQKTGLQGGVLTDAIRRVWLSGRSNEPSLGERKKRHRENTSAGKGGVALAIAPYLPLDLTPKQTMVAIAFFDRKAYQQGQLATAYARERYRHGLQRPVKELHDEAQRDKRRSEDELMEIVKKRMAAQRIVILGHFDKPQTLRAWHMLETFAPPVEVSLDAIQIGNIRDKALLAEVLGDSDLVPETPLETEYLLLLYRAQKAAERGDTSLIDNFPEHYEKEIPDVNKLSKQRAIIYKKA